MTNSQSQDHLLLTRLKEIVIANLNNQQFGVSDLSNEVGKSRSYLHRRLKSITNESISQFINRIRLEKSVELLQSDKYTVSEVAYDVGFNSPAYFGRCFHKHFGYPPGEMKTRLFSEKRNYDGSRNKSSKQGINGKRNEKSYRKKYILVILLFFVVSVSCLLAFWKNQQVKNPEISIAVLPLKTTENDLDCQILANGIMEDILNRLSALEGIMVKSRNSSEKYGNTNFSTREIAKELGVTHTIEGTLIKENDKVRIYIQLIDAIDDEHIWADTYENSFAGILNFISEASTQIANELHFNLSSVQKEKVKKVHTANPDAYQMYLKGRYFWHRRGEDYLNLSIDYFNQALQKDSNLALAYAGLADSYLVLPFHSSFPNDEAYLKTIKYANKALGIDKNMDGPHVAIGTAEMYFKLNWKQAEKEFLYAIKLNSNNAEAFQFYAEFLHKVNRLEEARKYADMAIKLDPFAYMKYGVSAFIYYDEEKFLRACKEVDKMLEFDKNKKWAYRIYWESYYRANRPDHSFDKYLDFLNLVDHDEDFLLDVNNIYKEDGMKGIINYEIERLKKYFIPGNIRRIADYYGMLEERDSTIRYLEKEARQPHAEGICDIKVDYDFKFLHDDQSFKALLQKANLPLD